MSRLEFMAIFLAVTIMVAHSPTAFGAEDAPPVPEPARKFVTGMYRLPEAGCHDLSAELDTPIFRGNRLFKHIKVMIYFQAPARHHLDIIGLPEKTREVFLEQLKPLTTLTEYLFCMSAILENTLKGSDLKVTREGEQYRIDATPLSEKMKAEFQSMTLWLDQSYRPVRLDQDSPDLGKISVRIETVVKEGKNAVSMLQVQGIKGLEGKIRMRIGYEKLDGFWLPSEVNLNRIKTDEDGEDVEGKPEKFLLKAYQINKGLPESTFPKEEEKPADKEDEGEEGGF